MINQSLLTKTTTLIATFIATIGMTIMFGVVMWIGGFHIIDEMSNPTEIAAHIDAMTSTQRNVHSWMTATLDVAYPLTYGAFFVGMALRFLGRFRVLLSLPGAIVVPVDLAEGIVQILALQGVDSVIWMKAYITPTKLFFWFLALGIALVAGAVAFKRRFLR